MSSAGLATTRAAARKSLTCAASVNRQPAELDERDLPRADSSTSSTSLWCAAPDQHGLVPQLPAGLVRVEHPGGDLARLRRLVVAAHQLREGTGAAQAGQLQLESLGLRADRVGQPQHGVPGPVVADQADHVQARVGAGPAPAGWPGSAPRNA